MIAPRGSWYCSLEVEPSEPPVTLDPTLWAYHRSRLDRPGARTQVAVLGASRISLGFDPEEFEQAYPQCDLVMLAAAGRAPPATLRSLAKDEDFTGIVVLGVSASHLTSRSWREQRMQVKRYERLTGTSGSINLFANRLISAMVNDSFAFRNRQVDLSKWAMALRTGDEHPQPYTLALASQMERMGVIDPPVTSD